MNRLRSRDVEGILKERGFEKGTAYCLAMLAEQDSAMRQELRETQDLVNRMADIVGNFVTVAGEMKKTVDSMKGKYDGEEDQAGL